MSFIILMIWAVMIFIILAEDFKATIDKIKYIKHLEDISCMSTSGECVKIEMKKKRKTILPLYRYTFCFIYNTEEEYCTRYFPIYISALLSMESFIIKVNPENKKENYIEIFDGLIIKFLYAKQVLMIVGLISLFITIFR